MFIPSSGMVKEHLLRYSFMEDHTQWMGDGAVMMVWKLLLQSLATAIENFWN
jgi:hypothetical protein